MTSLCCGHGTDASPPRTVMEDGFARSSSSGPCACRVLRTAARTTRIASQGPGEPSEAQLHQLLQTSLVRSDRIEAEASLAPQQEETWRPTRTSQGPPRLGPAREGPRYDQLHPDFLSPLWSRAFRRGSQTADPPSR